MHFAAHTGSTYVAECNLAESLSGSWIYFLELLFLYLNGETPLLSQKKPQQPTFFVCSYK